MGWKIIHHGDLDDAPIKPVVTYSPSSTTTTTQGEGVSTAAQTQVKSQRPDASTKEDIDTIARFFAEVLLDDLEDQPLPNVFQRLAEYGVAWLEAAPILHLFTSQRISYINDLKKLGDSVRFKADTVDSETLLKHLRTALTAALWRTQ